MASLTKLGNHRWLVQFYLGKRRYAVRIGRMAERAAMEVLLHFERLIVAKVNGTLLEQATRDWLGSIDADLKKKLVRTGLIADSKVVTLGEFVASMLEKTSGRADGTQTKLKMAAKRMLEFFDGSKPLESFTEGDADEYRAHLRGIYDSENSVKRHCGYARQFFRAAVRRRLISISPFADMKGLSVKGRKDRDYFITAADAEKVLAAMPDDRWRLLFALARWGGFRIPSEAATLAWSDINWELDRMVVRSPKNQQHDSGVRIIPIFPEIKPHLEAMYAAAPDFDKDDPDTALVFQGDINIKKNLRRLFTKLVIRAGLKPWPKLWQNLRSTRAIELIASGFAAHVVFEWIGHTEAVSREHYLRVTDEDFQKAHRKAHRAAPESASKSKSASHADEQQDTSKGEVK
jgi:integrase